MNIEEKKVCPICAELIKKIELTETSYEAIDLETALYKHQLNSHRETVVS